MKSEIVNSLQLEANSLKLIKKLLIKRLKGKMTYKTTPFKQGTAIMGYIDNDPQAAFWFYENKLTAANGNAMAWTNKKLEYSPAGIDFQSILNEIEKS